MNTFYEQLIARKIELMNAINVAEKIVASAPHGRLRVARTPAGAHFFMLHHQMIFAANTFILLFGKAPLSANSSANQ